MDNILNKDNSIENIYTGLTGLMEDKLKEEDIILECSTENLKYSLGVAPKVIDYNIFEGLEGEDFLEAVYFTLYGRLPSDALRTKVAGFTREEIIRMVTSEGAYAIRKLKVINGPYGDITPGLSGKILSLAASVSSSVLLRNIAKKMPKGIQNRIRRLFC